MDQTKTTLNSVEAFNEMARTFADDLLEAFPNESLVARYASGLGDVASLDPKKPMTLFLDAMAPHTEALTAKDPAIFESLGFSLDAWSSAPDATKNAIWQYLNTLRLLATTVNAMPAEILTTIESLASDCAQQIQDGTMDMGSMMSVVMSKMQGMDLSALQDIDMSMLLNGLGGSDSDVSGLANLLGGAGAGAGLGGMDLASLLGGAGAGAGGLGGMDLASLMGGGGAEDDILKMLENTPRPVPGPTPGPSRPPRPPGSRPSGGSGSSKKKSHHKKK